MVLVSCYRAKIHLIWRLIRDSYSSTLKVLLTALMATELKDQVISPAYSSGVEGYLVSSLASFPVTLHSSSYSPLSCCGYVVLAYISSMVLKAVTPA